VYTTSSLAKAEILRNVIEADGIKCELDSENQGSFSGIVDVRVLVHAWNEERALKALAAHGRQSGRRPGKQVEV
jgi:hypothetical protein